LAFPTSKYPNKEQYALTWMFGAHITDTKKDKNIKQNNKKIKIKANKQKLNHSNRSLKFKKKKK